ncbi:MAG: xanthomonadin transporter, partial [Xanthomonadaceae bacterium]|nr:xanthomonadin transporter [Xanthomonadaceae bacterium]
MIRGARVAIWFLWLTLVAGIGWGVALHLKISSDLRDFVPPARTADQKLLLDEIGKGPGSRLLLLAISGAPQAQLADLSRGLDDVLAHDPAFAHVANGGNDLAEIASDLLPYRYLLSPTLDAHRLDAAYLREQLQQRIEDLSSPAASMLEPWLKRDPTLETLKLAQILAPQRQPKLVDGVWFSDRGEALLVAETRAAGFDPGAQASAVASLQKHFASLPGSAKAKLVISGPGWFGVQASRHTRAEADRFGAITTVGFILMLLLAYRS